MPVREWEAFKRETLQAVHSVAPVRYFTGDGHGYSEEWGYEQAMTVIVQAPDTFGLSTLGNMAVRESLRIVLGDIARKYGQEAVALTYGVTTFARGVS